MKTSVALCTYNGARFLQEQLDSISAQTCQPDEVIVGDDGSTDETLAILERWKNTVPFPVRILTHEKNLGHTKNFEATARECIGDVVFFCDQDDIWLPEKVATVMNVFETQPDVGLVCHNTTVMDENGKDTGLTEITLRERGNRRSSLRYFCPVNEKSPIVSGCCMAVRTEFLRKTFPFFCAHDVCIYAMARAETKIETIFEPLMKFRYHSQNVSLCATWKEECAKYTELERSRYRLDVSRFWGHFTEIEEFLRRLALFPDSPEKREIQRFIRFIASHLTNRSRIQRNAFFFAPLFLYEFATCRYFRRDQPLRSIFYDLYCGILGEKEP